MLLQDRRHAGELLAEKLLSYRGTSPLILAVPRGGVPVALPLWRSLGGDLDLVITRKIGAPGQRELALGAVTGGGCLLLNEALAAQLQLPAGYMERVSTEEQAEIKRRLQLYRGRRPQPEIAGRQVIVVDDGVATGFTLRAALLGIKQQSPRRLILAVPVGPPKTLERLGREVDEIYYIQAPPYFAAVGQFYRDFTQVGDSTVIDALQEAWRSA